MIDITNLTSLITAFRQETEQGSISPETLGSLLQAIANLLSAASTDQEQTKLSNIYDNLLKMGNCLTNLAQGDADRNNVLADYTFYNPVSGLHSAQRSQIFIKQATTERAGAMRAQQVIDLNVAKKGVATLEDEVSNIQGAIATNNANYETRFSELDQLLTDLNGYIESVDGASQGNADQINILNSFASRLGYVPYHQGNIVIDNTSITSPIANYFSYGMADGYYNIVRTNKLIGRAVVSTYNNFKIVDVIGLCHINSNSFVYHDRLDHILMRIASNGAIYVTGSIETTDLKNQINLKQDKLTAGTGIDIDNNVISVNVIPESSFTLEFTASDGVVTGSFDETTYNELRQAIIDGKMIVVAGGVTRTTAISTALADDYLMIRYSVPRIQDDNATVTLSVYELKVSASSFTSKSIHKILPAA